MPKPTETLQPTFIEVDEEVLKSAELVCNSAISNAEACLNEAMERTFIAKNRLDALVRMYNEEIKRAVALKAAVRKLLGYADAETD